MINLGCVPLVLYTYTSAHICAFWHCLHLFLPRPLLACTCVCPHLILHTPSCSYIGLAVVTGVVYPGGVDAALSQSSGRCDWLDRLNLSSIELSPSLAGSPYRLSTPLYMHGYRSYSGVWFWPMSRLVQSGGFTCADQRGQGTEMLFWSLSSSHLTVNLVSFRTLKIHSLVHLSFDWTAPGLSVFGQILTIPFLIPFVISYFFHR